MNQEYPTFHSHPSKHLSRHSHDHELSSDEIHAVDTEVSERVSNIHDKSTALFALMMSEPSHAHGDTKVSRAVAKRIRDIALMESILHHATQQEINDSIRGILRTPHTIVEEQTCTQQELCLEEMLALFEYFSLLVKLNL